MCALSLTFGVFPHDLGGRVPLYRTVEDPCLAVDTVLVVGLDHEARRHWEGESS